MKQKFFNLAKRLSKQSDHHQHKMACVIVDKNRVVSAAFNRIKTHPASNARFQMCHAEISALIGLSYEELKGCVAYVYRETKDGSLAMAKPCQACEAALKQAGIKFVYYTTNGAWTMERLTA